MNKGKKCVRCGRNGLVLDRDGLCHECWQELRDDDDTNAS